MPHSLNLAHIEYNPLNLQTGRPSRSVNAVLCYSKRLHIVDGIFQNARRCGERFSRRSHATGHSQSTNDRRSRSIGSIDSQQSFMDSVLTRHEIKSLCAWFCDFHSVRASGNIKMVWEGMAKEVRYSFEDLSSIDLVALIVSRTNSKAVGEMLSRK